MGNMVVAAKSGSLLMDPQQFQHVREVGKMMSQSGIFPDHLRKGGEETAISNAVMVLAIADQMGESPITVSQNIHFVRGKAGWSASYMISRANTSGLLKSPIRFKTRHFESKPIAIRNQEVEDIAVTAYATLADGTQVDAEVTMRTAVAEGWALRSPNSPDQRSKYETMGHQMLSYRSASALIRLYCPEVMLGYRLVEELADEERADMRDITPPDMAPAQDPQPEVQQPAPAAATPKPEPEPDPEPAAQDTKAANTGRKAAQERYRQEQKDKSAAADAKAQTQAPAEPEPETKPEPSAAAPDHDPEPVEDAEIVDEGDQQFNVALLPEDMRSLYEQIKDSLTNAKNTGQVEAAIDIFAQDILYVCEHSEATADHLQELQAEARERVAAAT
ncbi:MAG: hypothetical protein AAF674_16785 [Pseudomonadota bacterium]